MKDLKYLLEKYESKKEEIRKRLREFKEVFFESDERIFAELAFCLCTPQSKALHAWKAIESLMKNGLLYKGSEEQIRPFLNSVRFGEKKSNYIIEARKKFSLEGKIKIKDFLETFVDPFVLRDWLVENVKGMGMKEASHFLRNIGFSFDLAILDVHILKNLKELKVIDEIPKHMNKKNYLKIEEKMREFSKKIGIPLAELDLLLWSEETGIIFK